MGSCSRSDGYWNVSCLFQRLRYKDSVVTTVSPQIWLPGDSKDNLLQVRKVSGKKYLTPSAHLLIKGWHFISPWDTATGLLLLVIVFSSWLLLWFAKSLCCIMTLSSNQPWAINLMSNHFKWKFKSFPNYYKIPD